MGLLKLYQNDDWQFDVMIDGWRQIQSPLLNINNPALASNTIIFTLDDHARGVDLPEIQTSVSIGRVSVDTLQHRLGRAGRGEKQGEGVVFLPSPDQETETVAKLASLGTIQVFDGLKQFYEENQADDGADATEK